MDIRLNKNNGFKWYFDKGIRVRGYFSYNNSFYFDNEMISVFDEVYSIEKFIEKLEQINGFFSVVIEREKKVFVASDRISTNTLYYSYLLDDLILSDDYTHLCNDSDTIDESASIEYLMLGYTTGHRTLLKNVHQLLPGECLEYDKKELSLKTIRYYQYDGNARNYDLPKDILIDELHKIHLRVFERFIDSLNGRKVVVPLSGGYDSRLIVEMLRKFDYDNVLCVTWGKKDDWQVKIAESVANELNYKWIRVNHTKKDWYNWFISDEFNILNESTGCISSIPYLQENVTIKYLENRKLISNDTIFISGNSGDFVEGEHIPKMFAENRSFTPIEIANEIFNKHYKLFRHKDSNRVQSIKDNIALNFTHKNSYTPSEASSLFELWEWGERQSKFVSKSIKPFESKGYEWRLPLWDNEIMDYWTRVPFNLKMNRRLFFDYSKKYMSANAKKANPNISKIKVYKERLLDSRYGCFVGYGFNSIRKAVIDERKTISIPLLNQFYTSSLILRKFNGLLALWNLSRMEELTKMHQTAKRNNT